MKKLEIININKHEYKLASNDGDIYDFILEFFDIEKIPQLGNVIYMSEELLNEKYEGYSDFYTFGNLDSKYGKANISTNDIDVIKVIIGDLEVYLKRLYG